MPRYLIKSRAKGPRVIRPIGEPTKTLQPGHQITADIDEPHLRYLERSRDFDLTQVEVVEAECQELEMEGEPGEAIQEPTVDASTGEPIPPIKRPRKPKS